MIPPALELRRQVIPVPYCHILHHVQNYKAKLDSGTVPSGAVAWCNPHKRMYKLSVYDAVYLELAKRRDAVLASLDGALLRTVAKEGIRFLD